MGSWDISHPCCSAGFQACCIAGFQTRNASGEADTLPTWKSATPQVWKPALHGSARRVAHLSFLQRTMRVGAVLKE